jgi:hypothetical protein
MIVVGLPFASTDPRSVTLLFVREMLLDRLKVPGASWTYWSFGQLDNALLMVDAEPEYG